jgi:SAM-dependent methyltransferase
LTLSRLSLLAAGNLPWRAAATSSKQWTPGPLGLDLADYSSNRSQAIARDEEDAMSLDPFAQLKVRQREMWASFGPTAMFTTPVAAHLVKFAGISAGETVLDVGTGTGVVAITAARAGAHVTALDLTPELLEQARDNARIAQRDDIVWTEGDAENLPYADAAFDVVVSQFGHMFAPRPDVVMAQIRRVLKPGGRVAFATWPPEHWVGRMFAFVGRNSPPPPPGAAPPPQWGNPTIVTERLGAGFDAPFFERGTMDFPALSIAHYRAFMERSLGPMQKLVESLGGEAEKLAVLRAEFDALVVPYYEGNVVRSGYLMTRALAR